VQLQQIFGPFSLISDSLASLYDAYVHRSHFRVQLLFFFSVSFKSNIVSRVGATELEDSDSEDKTTGVINDITTQRS
jgi:hypothetical protein